MLIQEKTGLTKTRRLTICNKAYTRAHNDYVSFPIISLSGKWLKECGFKSGQVIDIACEEGKLVITLSAQQKYRIE